MHRGTSYNFQSARWDILGKHGSNAQGKFEEFGNLLGAALVAPLKQAFELKVLFDELALVDRNPLPQLRLPRRNNVGFS